MTDPDGMLNTAIDVRGPQRIPEFPRCSCEALMHTKFRFYSLES